MLPQAMRLPSMLNVTADNVAISVLIMRLSFPVAVDQIFIRYFYTTPATRLPSLLRATIGTYSLFAI